MHHIAEMEQDFLGDFWQFIIIKLRNVLVHSTKSVQNRIMKDNYLLLFNILFTKFRFYNAVFSFLKVKFQDMGSILYLIKVKRRVIAVRLQHYGRLLRCFQVFHGNLLRD